MFAGSTGVYLDFTVIKVSIRLKGLKWVIMTRFVEVNLVESL